VVTDSSSFEVVSVVKLTILSIWSTSSCDREVWRKMLEFFSAGGEHLDIFCPDEGPAGRGTL